MHIFQVQNSIKMVKPGDICYFPVLRNEKQTRILHTNNWSQYKYKIQLE